MEKEKKDLGVPVAEPTVALSAVSPRKAGEDAAPIANAVDPNRWLSISKANRYKCVHCGKIGYSAGHMRRHANRCTANPDRKCGMHYKEHLFDSSNRRFEGYHVRNLVQAAISILPDIAKFPAVKDEFGVDVHPGLQEATAAVFAAAVDAVNGCPACTLAALRQSGIGHNVTVFDFKKAVEEWRNKANDEYGHRWQ